MPAFCSLLLFLCNHLLAPRAGIEMPFGVSNAEQGISKIKTTLPGKIMDGKIIGDSQIGSLGFHKTFLKMFDLFCQLRKYRRQVQTVIHVFGKI